MKIYSQTRSKGKAEEDYDFEEEHDGEDFFSDDINNYTDTMGNFRDK